MSGFHSESYAHEVREFVRDRKETLGVRPTDFSPRVMKEKVKEYYDMSFRGETAALQVIVGEFRVAHHWHDGRPKKTYCSKCRLLEEIRYLARPWQLNSRTEDKMMWFSMSDVESESDDDIKKEVKLKREAKWAEDNVTGLSEGKGWQRSKRIQSQAAADTTQVTATAAQATLEEGHDNLETEMDNGGADAADEGERLTVSPQAVEGLLAASRALNATVAALTPEKKGKKRRRR